MEVDVVRVVPPAGEFLYLSAPPLISSLSAPTSPSHGFNFFRLDDETDDVPIASPSAVPFLWEEKPGTPKSSSIGHDVVNGFEFDHFTALSSFSKHSLPADVLFHAGKIKPLNPPPGFQSNISSPHNSRFSPRKSKSSIDMNMNEDPFEAALTKETLIPHDSHYSETALAGDHPNSGAGKEKSSSFMSAISFSKPSTRWKLRDLLFRSATEKPHNFRSTYVAMDDDDDVSSFRSADGGGSTLHFTLANRSVSDEFIKKRRSFPKKPGFLSRCLRFNRSGTPEISRGIGSLSRG